MAKIVTISGKDYDYGSLNETAQKMVANVAAADAKLEQLRTETSMIQLARDVYVQNLLDNLPQDQPAATVRPAAKKAPAKPAAKKSVH